MGATGKSGNSVASSQLPAPTQTTPKQLDSNSTSSEIKSYYKNNFNMDIGGSWFQDKCDNQILVETSKQLDRLKNDLGQDVFDEMGLRIVSYDKMNPNAYGLTSLTSGKITINGKVFQDMNKANASYASNSSFHPKGTDIGSVIPHEFGHNLEFLINKRVNKNNALNQYIADADQTFSRNIVKAAYADIQTSNPGMFKSEKQARASISGYADSKWHGNVAYTETMAEAVSDYAKNGSNATAMSKAIWKNIVALLK